MERKNGQWVLTTYETAQETVIVRRDYLDPMITEVQIGRTLVEECAGTDDDYTWSRSGINVVLGKILNCWHEIGEHEYTSGPDGVMSRYWRIDRYAVTVWEK